MIEVRDFGFRYRESEECAVRDVNLSIPKGSFVGITGAAASGKSTLTYALNGIVPHCYPGDFYGSVRIDGVDTVEASLTDISRLVGSVCQDVDSQIVAPIVEDEILYGMENFGVPRDEGLARMDEVLRSMGIEALRSREVASLSGGQKQKVAIASILAMRPQVLVLDEPTAELDPAASRNVFDLLKAYARERGITVVVVEQKIALLADYADMIVVMEKGQVRFADAPDQVLSHASELYAMGVNVPRVTSLTRRLADEGVYGGAVCRTVSQAAACVGDALADAGSTLGDDACAAPAPASSASAPPRRLAIEFRNVFAGYAREAAVLRGVDFSIGEGEFVAFVGTNGAGKSTAMRMMNGLLKPSSGSVSVFGADTASCPTSELARSVGFLFQNPDRQICKSTVREELLFGFEATGRDDSEAQRMVDATIEEFALDADADPFLLSRGSRQLLALASVAVTAPRAIVLDEPTTGLDFRECEKIMRFVKRLHDKGTTVVMVCHDMEVVADFAQRAIVMTEGRVVADGPVFGIMRDPSVLAVASIEPSQMPALSLALKERMAHAGGRIARANTLEEMHDALYAALSPALRTPGAISAPAAMPLEFEGRRDSVYGEGEQR